MTPMSSSTDVATGTTTTRAPAPASDWRRDAWLVLLLVALVALKWFPGLDALRPVVMEDELGYLMNARTMAGVGERPSLGEMGFYFAGWSTLVAPLWWLFSSSGDVYRTGVLLAGLLSALTVLPLRRIARRHLGMGVRSSWAVAACATCLPGTTLMAGYMYAESLVTLLVTLLVLVALEYGRRPAAVGALALAGTAVAAYATHGRVIAAPVLAVLLVLAVVLRRRAPARHAVLALGLVALGLLAVSQLHGWLQASIYALAFDRISLGISSLTSIDERALWLVAGQLWYSAVSTAGLTLVGAVVVTAMAWREVRSGAPGPWLLFTLLAGSVLLISGAGLQHAMPDPLRLDYYVYGRYIDCVAPVLVVVALAALARVRGRGVVVAAGAVSAAVVVLALVPTTAWGADAVSVDKPIAALSVPGIAVWLAPGFSRIPWVPASVAAIALVLVAALLATRSRAAALALVTAGFVALTVAGEVRTMRVLDAPWHDMTNLDRVLVPVAPHQIAYDSSSSHLYGRNSYQFWLPDTEFEFVDVSEQVPDEDLVITRREWPTGEAAGARRVLGERGLDQALWVLPGDLADRFDERGLLEQPEGVPLPRSAHDAGLTVLGSSRTGDERDALVVKVEHEGGGAVWPALGTQEELFGTVRLLLQVTCDDESYVGIGDLPRSLVPGDSAEVVVVKPEIDSTEGCEQILTLMEEGVGAFGDEVALP